MKDRLHEEIEALAGAIALGEATDGDRRFYREHLATCPDCLRELGGEHELERTAAAIANARDSEVWQPQVSLSFERRGNSMRQVARFAAAFAVTIAAVAGVLHWFTIPNAPAAAPPETTVAVTYTPPPKIAKALPLSAQHSLVVYHNVVQLARAPVAYHASRDLAQSKPAEIASQSVFPQSPPVPKHAAKATGAQPVWRTVSRMTTTALTETAPQRVNNAEMIQLGLSARNVSSEAAPVGGETSINPQPPMIAYAEQIEGTTVYEVTIDERGAPLKCTITKPSGYRFLDDAVCKAAMKARFTPKVVAGRAVAGVFHDAFTFRSTPEPTGGLPNPVPTIRP